MKYNVDTCEVTHFKTNKEKMKVVFNGESLNGPGAKVLKMSGWPFRTG